MNEAFISDKKFIGGINIKTNQGRDPDCTKHNRDNQEEESAPISIEGKDKRISRIDQNIESKKQNTGYTSPGKD